MWNQVMMSLRGQQEPGPRLVLVNNANHQQYLWNGIETLHIEGIADLSSATQPIQILHADLCGPIHHSVGHDNYFVGMMTDRY